MTATRATLLAMVSGDQIKRGRERAGMTQLGLARAVSVSRTTVANWEAGSVPRNKLGKVLEVLGLGPDGRPSGTSVVDADLRGLPVSDLVALQGRLTAEFARRLGKTRQDDPPAPPGWGPSDVVAFPYMDPPEGADVPTSETRKG